MAADPKAACAEGSVLFLRANKERKKWRASIACTALLFFRFFGVAFAMAIAIE